MHIVLLIGFTSIKTFKVFVSIEESSNVERRTSSEDARMLNLMTKASRKRRR